MADRMVMRKDIEDWVMIQLSGSQTKNYYRVGKGYTALDETLNPKTESKQYISDAEAVTTTTGYETSFSFTTDFFDSEKPTRYIYNIARNRSLSTGDTIKLYRLEVYKGNQEDSPSAGQWKYIGREIPVSIEVSSISGGGGEAVSITGAFHPTSDPKNGTLACSGGATPTYTWTDVDFSMSTDMARE